MLDIGVLWFNLFEKVLECHHLSLSFFVILFPLLSLIHLFFSLSPWKLLSHFLFFVRLDPDDCCDVFPSSICSFRKCEFKSSSFTSLEKTLHFYLGISWKSSIGTFHCIFWSQSLDNHNFDGNDSSSCSRASLFMFTNVELCSFILVFFSSFITSTLFVCLSLAYSNFHFFYPINILETSTSFNRTSHCISYSIVCGSLDMGQILATIQSTSTWSSGVWFCCDLSWDCDLFVSKVDVQTLCDCNVCFVGTLLGPRLSEALGSLERLAICVFIFFVCCSSTFGPHHQILSTRWSRWGVIKVCVCVCD